jgi:cytochrome c-type biogenesis protein CcsB
MSASDFEQFSLLSIWTAIALYALALLIYAFDIARRAQHAADRVDAAVTVREKVLVGADGTNPVTGGGASIPAASAAAGGKRNLYARIATSVMWLGLLFHFAGIILRGLAIGHVPWSNLYEFAMTGTFLVSLVYLVVLFFYDLRYLGSFISLIVVLFLAGATLSFYVKVVPLADPLKSVWLVIHVFVATLACAFFALACGLSILQLMQSRRAAKIASGAAPVKRSFLDTIPDATRLEGLAYRFTIVGFILWTFTLIAGSIWANDAWGRYWGFDTKEVWTFVIWVLYAGYIHARATRGWRGARSAWLSIVGFAAVLFNFTIVNVFFKGLHAYSGLS